MNRIRLILIPAILALLLTACAKPAENAPEQNTGTDSAAQTKLDNATSDEGALKGLPNGRLPKRYEERELVYTAAEFKAGETTCAVPAINLQSDDAMRINEEIDQKYRVETFLWGSSYYNYYFSGEVLSLVIETWFTGSDVTYDTYNIDIKSGKQISNEQLLAKIGLTKEAFLEALSALHHSRFITEYGTKEEYLASPFADGSDEEEAAFYDRQLEASVAPENYDFDLPLFMKNGQIYASLNLYAFVGGECYYHLAEVTS